MHGGSALPLRPSVAIVTEHEARLVTPFLGPAQDDAAMQRFEHKSAIRLDDARSPHGRVDLRRHFDMAANEWVQVPLCERDPSLEG